VRKCLTVDPTNRPTIAELLADPWLKSPESAQTLQAVDLLPNVKSGFDAKKTWRKAVFGVVAVQRMNATFHGGQSDAEKKKFIEEVERYKTEAEEVG
jgi:calcium/calmodulin-dependent protein kinase I